MDKGLLEHFRGLLNKEKDELQKVLSLMDKNQSAKFDQFISAELSNYDNHPADLGSELFEVEKNLALKNDIIRKIKLIDNALKKVDYGNYGICDYCQSDIEIERLEYIPYAKFCIKCENEFEKDSNEHANERPSEEKFMGNPFNNLFKKDIKREDYSGVDIWSIMKIHSISDGPQDNIEIKENYNYYKDINEINDIVEETDKISEEDNKKFFEGR